MTDTPFAKNGLGRQRVALLLTHFFTRTDQVAALMPWGRPHPIEGGDNIAALIDSHVLGKASSTRAVARYLGKKAAPEATSGHFRLGSYSPDPDGNTRWLCLDFDGGTEHSASLADPEGAAIEAHLRCTTLGLASHLERSGGGQGYHLWVLFSDGVSAKDARRLGFAIAPRGALLDEGSVADPRHSCGIEVFPKQDRIKKEGGYGNFVWLPWWSDAPEGANEFLRLEGARLVANVPESFETVTPDQLAVVVRTLPGPRSISSARAANGSKRGPSKGSKSEEHAFQESPNAKELDGLEDAGAHSPLKVWQEEALAALPLEKVYGPWLTGKSSETGWFECRDPASPTGDQTPSAGVADGSGDARRGTFHSFRSGTSMSIFDFMIQNRLASNFRDAVQKVGDWTQVPLPERQSQSRSSPKAAGKPIIVSQRRQLEEIIRDATDALALANAGSVPWVYSQAGRVVRLVLRDGRPEIERLDRNSMFGICTRMADWVRRTEDGDIPVFPPHEVADDLLEYPPESLPALRQVVTAPVFDQRGRLVDQPGFDRFSGVLYYRTESFNVAPVPRTPTSDEILAAKAVLLDELLVNFPFVNASDKAHAVAAIILPFVRNMIDGPTPIHLIGAPVPGSGKTLVGEIICILATGEKAEPTTLPRDNEEIRKKLLSLLLSGPQVVLLDNVTAGMDSGELAAVITAERFKDRVLGVSATACPPNRTVWLVSSNNPSPSTEIRRRSVPINIDPGRERPWERRDFKHCPIKPWALEHRAEIVHAVLTLVQAWIAEGCPSGTRPLGSFETWAAVLGGILDVVRIEGFLDNMLDANDASDAENQEWREFVARWWERHSSTPVTVKTLMGLTDTGELLLGVLGPGTERSQSVRMGKALTCNRSRVFGEFRILAAQVSHNQRMWKLAKIDTPADHGNSLETPAGTHCGGIQLPFQRDIPTRNPLHRTASNLTEGDVGDVGDSAASLAEKGVKAAYGPRLCLCPQRAYGQPFNNIPLAPQIPQTQPSGSSDLGDSEVDVSQTSGLESPDVSQMERFEFGEVGPTTEEVEP